MSKFYYVFFVFWLLLPQTANAALIVPSADILVAVNSTGGDGSFNFEFNGSTPFSYFENFSLTTLNSIALYNIHIPFLTTSNYQLNQILPAGWQQASVTCTGNFSSSGNIVQLTISPLSTTTCTFSNKKTITRNPVLFIPGITGSNLSLNQEKLWLDFGRMMTDVGDDFLDSMSFNTNLEPLNQLHPDSVIEKVDPLGNFHAFDYTDGLKKEFQVKGYLEGVDFFTFPYDWRLGTNEQNLSALKNKIETILTTTGATKVDVVAHSAGGVLLKKYILDNNDHHVGKAIFVGVPNLGAPKALKILLEGDNMGIPVLSAGEIKKIARNMPGVYQLTPSNSYENLAGSTFATHTQNIFSSSDVDLGFTDTQSYLVNNKDLNLNAFTAANNLHTVNFDSADITSKGVDVYNIVGCKQPTLGKIIERKTNNPILKPIVNGYAAKFVAGDGTVTLPSAERAPGASSQFFYALDSDHGKMPSQNGIRQEIVKLITGDQSINTPSITLDRAQCKLNGKQISIYSPLDISVTDSMGNITQVNSGDVQIEIPGSNLEVLGDHKFLFLPDGQEYNVKVEGIGDGAFTLIDDTVASDQIIERNVFANVPVSRVLKGELDLSFNQLRLDANGDGNIETTIEPYALGQDQINDVAPPVTQVLVTGNEDEPGFFRSDVNLTLCASDALSGVMSTKYILDDGQMTDYTNPFVVTSEGSHILKYFSIDRAGNVEISHTLEFVVDKASPEFTIQYDSTKHDVIFSSDGTVTDNDDVITSTDRAGNITKLVLKEKNRKAKLKAEIKQLFYNGTEVDLSKNVMKFNWKYDNVGVLKKLSEQVKSKTEFHVALDYNGRVTAISGKDASGPINRIIVGPINPIGPLGLMVKTNKGDLEWSY